MGASQPEIQLVDPTEAGSRAFSKFVAAATSQPEVTMNAVQSLCSDADPAENTPEVAAVRETVTALLDETMDGFNIDYDQQFIRDCLRQSPLYQERIKRLHEEKHSGGEGSRQALRDLALTGLILYLAEKQKQ